MPDDPVMTADTDRLTDAIMLACEAHRGQVDKAGAPYILHPLRVMLAVTGDDERIAAVQHDVVEDCGVAPATIAARFGEPAAQTVMALSRQKGETLLRAWQAARLAGGVEA